MDDDTRKREFGNLESIKDNYLLPHPPLPPISPQEYRRHNGRGKNQLEALLWKIYIVKFALYTYSSYLCN